MVRILPPLPDLGQMGDNGVMCCTYSRLILVLLFFFSLACGRKSGTTVAALNAPNLLHVSNGTKLAYYRESGVLGFISQDNSVFTTTLGNTSQVAQHPTEGTFVIGSICSGCNYFTMFEGVKGGYRQGTLDDSKILLNRTDGIASGMVISPDDYTLYVSDTVNKSITQYDSRTGSAKKSSVAASTTDFSGNTFVQKTEYLAFDSGNNILLFTDPTAGKVFFVKTENMQMPTGLSDGLSLLGTDCVTVKYPLAVADLGKIFVLCNGTTTSSVIVLNSTNYTYAVGNTLSASTITINTPTLNDLVYSPKDQMVYVVGGGAVYKIDPVNVSIAASKDTSADCGTTNNLSSIAIRGDRQLLFVSDSTNSKIYKLNSTNLYFNTSSNCAASSFSTSTYISGPNRLSFF